jgi:raffinose/stachyose/melibiose transport system permease protein
MVPGVSIYNLAFSYGKVGEASALAVVLSLLVYLVVLVMNFLARNKD